jgi:C4-dicarboxylate-specific signal transduction histidine kinase
MKQPLTAISLIAESTQFGLSAPTPSTPDETHAALSRIVMLVERASKVTEHLRDIARSQDEGLTAYSVRAAVDGALLMCGFALRQAEIAISVDLPEDLPMVVGHQVLTEQVLMNLFLNARDAMGEMKATERRLRVTATATVDRVQLKVRDNGPGIPPKVMARLFEPFFTTKPAGVGTGLGLSICASILKACGGNISAANPRGGGAEFTITLLAEMTPALATAES